MWEAKEVASLRAALGLNRARFARLLGVDARTVQRWESDDGPRPKGSAAEILSAIQEELSGEPRRAGKLVKLLAGAASVGGLAYLMMKLLRRATEDDNGEASQKKSGS